MAEYQVFQKLQSHLGTPITYELVYSDRTTPLILGENINLYWTGTMTCLSCQSLIKKTFQNGYCFQCFSTKASCDMCILRPERCHYHLGTCREPNWGLAHCFTEHVVYLANSTGLKVGISRKSNIPQRWIDQGAKEACVLLTCSNRLISGQLESFLARTLSDKTKWQQLLQGVDSPLDMSFAHAHWQNYLKMHLQAIGVSLSDVTWVDFQLQTFKYPVDAYALKAKSIKLAIGDNQLGQLLGVRGQYLIFQQGGLNMRNLQGYHIINPSGSVR
ncbi:MAG: DUF2797 domain-containing protein [Gammaproteobacteria bacterium]|jgi:hypothetical protein|nr:DUF2797 domain-containing protein [Gammaproteobacteria bacterium]